jgi:hypothetical protein
MRHALKVIPLFLGLFLALLSCATGAETPPASQNAQVSSGPTQDVKDAETRMNTFLSNGLQKIEQGSISEGVQQLVAVLAVRDSLQTSSTAADDAANKANASLTQIGAALSLDSGTEWLDENKNQISANALDVGTPKAIQPSVILAYNMGMGRTLVAGAPIAFEFTKGSGVMTGYVTTNEYGQANCSITKFDSPAQEQIIRASLVFAVGGFVYRFQGVTKEFAYLPPTRRATILVMERSPAGANQPPIILDQVYNTLKGVAFDFSQYDGTLLGDDFMKVFSGDPQAIKDLGMKKDVSYLVMVLNDCYSAVQVVVGDVKYNIFKSMTTATTRIIRVVDGKILYSAAVQSVAGQGGATDKAIIDGFKNAATAMAAKLKTDLPEINKVLTAAQGK